MGLCETGEIENSVWEAQRKALIPSFFGRHSPRKTSAPRLERASQQMVLHNSYTTKRDSLSILYFKKTCDFTKNFYPYFSISLFFL